MVGAAYIPTPGTPVEAGVASLAGNRSLWS